MNRITDIWKGLPGKLRESLRWLYLHGVITAQERERVLKRIRKHVACTVPARKRGA